MLAVRPALRLSRLRHTGLSVGQILKSTRDCFLAFALKEHRTEWRYRNDDRVPSVLSMGLVGVDATHIANPAASVN